MAPKKRGTEPDAETSEQNKRYKSAIDDVASEFVCPISQELPLDPVMAEDGHVYERHAIEDWLKRQQKSPLTNEPMGQKLVAAHGVKNTIRKLVASGAISGGRAEAWQQRLEEEAEVMELRSKAEAGDADAMAVIGDAFFLGDKGLPEDEEKAREWYERADDAGNACGAHGLGLWHCWKQDAVLAAAYLVEAGARGESAAYHDLAERFADGLVGFRKDKKQARHWYSKALEISAAASPSAASPQFRPMGLTDEYQKAAEDWLRENPA